MFKPSVYQQNIFNFVTNGKGSAVVSAVAGSGKTTTIVECAKLLPNKEILFLAFNKEIVTTLSQKLNAPNITCSTTHSFGFKAITKALKTKVRVDNYKWRNYINTNAISLSDMISEDMEDSILRNFLFNIHDLFNMCRINLVNGSDIDKINKIALHHNIDIIADEINIVSTLLDMAYNINLGDSVDFIDMIVLPSTQFSKYVGKFDMVFVDECQDLNTAQRELLKLALKPYSGRFIAVGDPKQAINGFAGATNNSFDLLKELANNNELPLSVNYRCGKNIIAQAKEFVPHITAFENSDMGKVTNTDNFNDLKNGDMILCRTSAPLIRLCLRMFANGMAAKVKGKDLGKNLISLIDKLNPKNINSLFKKLDDEIEKLAKKLETLNVQNIDDSTPMLVLKDKIDCLEAFAEKANSIREMKSLIEFTFSDDNMKNAIMLSTVHKSKGLENDRVFIILPEKLPLKWKGQQDWEYEQELNLKYVAITRAKKELVWVNLDKDQLAKYDFSKI